MTAEPWGGGTGGKQDEKKARGYVLHRGEARAEADPPAMPTQRAATSAQPHSLSARSRAAGSVPEMADAREDHCHAALVRRLDHFFVANRTARLNRRRGPCIRGRDQAIRKRKERFARHD